MLRKKDITRQKMRARTKLMLTLSFMAALLLLAGCSKMGGFFKGKGTGTMETYDFRKGTDGLEMQFVEGMPPKQLFVGADFTIGLRVKNKGAYDVTDRSELKISVPDDSAFRFSEGNLKRVALTGKSPYIKEGAEDVLLFPMTALCFPGYDGTMASIRTNYTPKIKASACYYYETTANADLCIDTMKYLRAANEKLVCMMKDVQLEGGQGGPVGLVSMSPNIIPQGENRTVFQLSLSIKKLKGKDVSIYHPESQCNVEGQNKVQIEAELGGEPLRCEPSEIYLLERDAVATVCKKDVNAALGAFVTPVSVRMRYYVEQSMLKEINVEPPPGGIDCSGLGTGGVRGGGAGRGSCTEQHPGYSCRTISCEAGEEIGSCAARQGCIRGLCPGGETNVCCP
jgi:hypothetical protein